MAEWQPIETAPRNETEILLWREGWNAAPVGHWGAMDDDEGLFCGWYLKDDFYVMGSCQEGFVGWSEDIADGHMPTHWAPLPVTDTPQAVSENGNVQGGRDGL